MSSLHLLPVTLILPLAIVYYYYRELTKTGTGRLYWAAVVMLVCLVGWSGWVISRVLNPGESLVSAELRTGPHPLQVPAGDGPLSLLVHGHLKSEQSESSSGTYALEIKDDAGHSTQLQGLLETHLERQKVGRSGVGKVRVDHLEERLDLPAEMARHPVTVNLTQVNGELRVPLEVNVIPSPPAQANVAALGVLFTLVGAAFDSRNKQTHFTLCMAVLASFTTLMCQQVTPDGNYNPIMGAMLASLFVGMFGGAFVRWLVGKVMPAEAAAG